MKTRIIIYSNNGHVSKCSSFVFLCAKLWHKFSGYSGLREIGSYVR